MSLLSFIIEARDNASKTINNVKQSFSGMGSLLGGLKGQILSSFAVGAVVSFGKSVVDYVGQIKDASEATGIASDRFQALAIAAKTNGVAMDQLAGSIARLRNLQSSIGSDEGVQKTFSKIGMSISDVQAADPEQLLAGIAKGLNETGDASVAFDVFGRGAAGLLTTLKELENGWDPLVEKMKSGIISKEDIEEIDEFGDKLDTLAIKAKSFGAGIGIGLVGLGKIIGGLFTSQAPGDVLREMAEERIANVKKNEDRKKLMEEARKASEKMAAEEADAKKTKISMDAAQKEGQGLSDQFAKSNLSDKDYAARLEEKSIALAAAANEEGLTALDRQTRMNEALKVEIELRTLQKKIKEDDNRKAEEAKRKSEAADKSLKDAEKGRDRYLESKKSPEEQLKDVEAKIAQTKPLLAAEKDPEKKADLLKEQTSNAEERDRLKKEIDDKKKARADKEQSLMVQDRELRESAMSPAQRIAESKKRAGNLEKQLGTERDPDKQLDIRTKLMDEIKAQTSLTKQETGRRSLTWGDVAERGYGQSGKKDPAREQVEVLHRVETLLKDIKEKPSGMTR